MPILEFIQHGDYIKVSAIDEETGIEAITILPKNLPRSDMEKAAMQKLKYVMKKKSEGADDSGIIT